MAILKNMTATQAMMDQGKPWQQPRSSIGTINGRKIVDRNYRDDTYTTEDGSIWQQSPQYDINEEFRFVGATPEKKVKDMIKARLSEAGAYFYMPVSNGMGAPQLDFICHIKKPGTSYAIAFYIEAKARGKKPTPRQDETIRQLRESGAAVFVIDGTHKTDMTKLDLWLLAHRSTG